MVSPKKKTVKKKAAPKKATRKKATVETLVQVSAETNDDQKGGVMSDNTIFEVPPYFGIAQVIETKESMASILNDSADQLLLEAEDVESIDTAALQLLVSFVKKAESESKVVSWKSCSDKLKTAAELLSLTEDLKI